jgi:hypothetical protein
VRLRKTQQATKKDKIKRLVVIKAEPKDPKNASRKILQSKPKG